MLSEIFFGEFVAHLYVYPFGITQNNQEFLKVTNGSWKVI